MGGTVGAEEGARREGVGLGEGGYAVSAPKGPSWFRSTTCFALLCRATTAASAAALAYTRWVVLCSDTEFVLIVNQVGEATLVARRSTLEARKKEAAEDKEGVGTEGEALPGEVYSAEREWVSEEFLEADATQKGQESVS